MGINGRLVQFQHMGGNSKSQSLLDVRKEIEAAIFLLLLSAVSPTALFPQQHSQEATAGGGATTSTAPSP
eukprot:7131688-Lingulodinium_polyedra.AAC.1